MKPTLFVLIFFSSFLFSGEPNLVYLVRHAEKVDESRDADLSQEGFRRATALKQFFEHVSIDRIFASQFQRTQKTVQPVAEAKDLTVGIVDARLPDKLIESIKSGQGQVILVAGHSNTVPDLIRLMGGPQLTIGHDDYSDLFLLILQDGKTILQRFQLNP